MGTLDIIHAAAKKEQAQNPSVYRDKTAPVTEVKERLAQVQQTTPAQTQPTEVSSSDGSKNIQTDAFLAAIAKLKDQRLQAARSEDSYAVDRINEQMKALRASVGKQTLGDRVQDTLSGAGYDALGSLTNAAGLFVNLFQDPERNRRQIERLRESLETGRTTDGMVITPAMRQTIEESIARMEGEAWKWESGDGAANRIYKAADAMDEAGEQRIQNAKAGLGKAGQFAVDVGAAGGQLVGDIAASAVFPGAGLAMMGARAFGGGAQEARQSGASVGEQMAYGAGNAALSVVVERIANVAGPFKKAFGEGFLEKLAPNLINRLSQSAVGKTALSALAEGGEEFVEAVIQPVLQRATYDETARLNLSDALYSAAIGAVLGAGGAGIDVAAQRGAMNKPAPNAVGERAASQPTEFNHRQENAAEGFKMRNEGAETEPETVAPQTSAEGDPLANAIVNSLSSEQFGISTEPDVNIPGSFDTGAEAAYNEPVKKTPPANMPKRDKVERERRWAEASKEARTSVDRLNNGESLTLEELMAIPEIARAKLANETATPTINLPNRESIVADGVEGLYAQGSYSAAADDFSGPVDRGYRMDIVIGLPGSGKSSAYSNELSERYHERIIDTDDARVWIPEYNGENAAAVHEEASRIRKAVQQRAMKNGENVLLSTIGDNAANLAEKIEAYRALGYEVHLHLNELPNQKSIARAIKRYIQDGRYVSPELIYHYGDGPTRAFLELTGLEESYGQTDEQRSEGLAGNGAQDTRGRNADVAGTHRGAESLASYDWKNNDVPFGEQPRLIYSSQQVAEESTPDGVNSVGAAATGFETPDSQGHERTSNINTGAAAYTRAEGEATGRTREDYDAMFRYQTQTEEQSMSQADNLLYVQQGGQRKFLRDVDEAAYDDIVAYLSDAPAWNGVMTDAAMLIKQELHGRSINMEITEDEYTDWLNIMREHATETGRGTQAWAKWTRRDNDGGQATELEAWEAIEQSNLSEEDKKALFRLIIRFDREIEAAETEEDLKRIILEISEERGTLSGITGRQSRILHSIAEKSMDGMDKGQLRQFAYSASAALSTDHDGRDVGDMLKTIQILNMLSNPKTPAKNLTGNTSFYALDAMSMRGAAILDMVLSKVTGTRSVAMERSVLGRDAREDISKAIQLSLAEVTMDVDMGSENRYQQGSRRTFKADGNFVERTLSALERNMGYLMTTTDEAYKGAARSTAKATQRLVDEGKIKNAGRDYAQERADDLALYRTFQGGGKVTTAIQTIHDVLNMFVGVGDSGKRIGPGENQKVVHSFGLGDMVAPFTRVAGNLASVGLDYSPVNAAKGTVEILDTIRNAAAKKSADPAKQAKAVSDFARGMTGSAIAYGVAALARAGLIKRADDEEDKDVASLNQSEGLMGTQVNIDAAKRWLDGGSARWTPGDTLIDVSNLEPINFIISLGVDLADNEADSFISTFGDVESYKETLMSALATAGDLPILSNVGDFAKDILVYGTSPVEAGAEMLGKTAVSSVTPNVVAAFGKGLDDKQRNIYSGDGVGDVLVDHLKSRIPGVREELPTTVNTLGEEKSNPGTLSERLLNAMLNPIGVNEYTQSAVSQEMERVREATGETGFYPTTRKPSELSYKDADGKEHTVTLSYEEQQKFQAACSATQMSYTESMMQNSRYQKADAVEQAALLERCYTFAYQDAKAGILGDDAVDAWVFHAKNAKREIGLSPTDYLYYYEKYGGNVMSGSGYETTRRMKKAGLTIDQWVRMKNGVDTNGNDSVTKAEVTAYIEEHFAREKWSGLFEAYKGNRNWKNPY